MIRRILSVNINKAFNLHISRESAKLKFNWLLSHNGGGTADSSLIKDDFRHQLGVL